MTAQPVQRAAAIRQMLRSHPGGLSCRQLHNLLNPDGNVKVMNATLHNMYLCGQLSRHGTRPILYKLTPECDALVATRAQRGGETRRQKHAERRAAQGSTIQKPTASRRAQARIDHMRTMAARKGVTATIPPAPAAEPAETVEQWMQRTGRMPEVLPNTFDDRQTKFPLRRPSMPRFTYHA